MRDEINLGQENGPELGIRLVELVVYDHMVKGVRLASLIVEFDASRVESLAQRLVRFGASLSEPLLQRMHAGRLDKAVDWTRVEHASLLQVDHSLYVNVESAYAARGEHVLHRLLARAIVVARELGILQELARLNASSDLFLRDEVVLAAVLFAGARLPGRV